MSDELSIKTGIGQGTILGPLLFIFYINDIINVKGILKINMYADDCILFKSGNNWNNMSVTTQRDLDAIHHWCERNRLKVSTTKSKCLLFGLRGKLAKVDYQKMLNLSDSLLPFVNSYKYLGITLGSQMDLTDLLSGVKKRITHHLFKLRKLRKYINVQCSLLIYKQTILPLLDYAGFLLNSCNVSDRDDLQVLQNDCLRTCYNVHRRDHLSISVLHNDAKLLSLDQRRKIQLLSLMYKHKTSHDVQQLFLRATRGAERYKFAVERYNVVKYKNSPYYKGSELWNALPQDTIDSTCFTQEI